MRGIIQTETKERRGRYPTSRERHEMERKHWTDNLAEDIGTRLANCRTRKEDLPALLNAMWLSYKENGKSEKGFTKEDALVAVLELLDCNSCFFDLTRDEYRELCR